MKSYLKCVMVCALIVLVRGMPQELEIDESGESEIETSATVTTSTTATTPTSTSTSTSTMRPTRSTTTARPFQPLRPNRPLASMVHSTLQSIESVVVSAAILATSLLESLMPAHPTNITKSYTSSETATNSQPSKYSTIDFRENELLYNFE